MDKFCMIRRLGYSLVIWAAMLVGESRALDITTTDGRTLHECVITKVETDFVKIRHKDGVAAVPWEKLPKSIQEKNKNAHDLAVYAKEDADKLASSARAEQDKMRSMRPSNQAQNDAKVTGSRSENPSASVSPPVKLDRSGSAAPNGPPKGPAKAISREADNSSNVTEMDKSPETKIFGVLGILVLLMFLLKVPRRIAWARMKSKANAFFKQVDKHGKLPVVSTTLLLRSGECAVYFKSSELFETRSVRTYQSGFAGVRLAKGIYVGQSRGRSFSRQELAKIDRGTLTVTSKRIVFEGSDGARAIPLGKILSASPWKDSVEVLSEGRQKAVVFSAENPIILATIIQLCCNEKQS